MKGAPEIVLVKKNDEELCIIDVAFLAESSTVNSHLADTAL